MIVRLTLLFLTISLNCKGYERTTSEIAAAEHYPAFITDYRNKVERLKESILIEVKLRIQKLESSNLFHRAEALQAFYENDFIRMQDTFDEFFINFDEEFLIGAQKLDDENALEQQKALFINQIKEKMGTALTTLLDLYKRKFNVLDASTESGALVDTYKKSAVPARKANPLKNNEGRTNASCCTGPSSLFSKYHT